MQVTQIKIRLGNLKNVQILLDIRPNAIQYLLRGQILQPQTIIFLLHLLFYLGCRGLLLASTTHLEAGSHFAEICKRQKKYP